MRLLTLNLMQCLRCEHFPLAIEAADIHANETQTYDRDFVLRMLGRIDYNILFQHFEQIKAAHPELQQLSLPPTLEQLDTNNDTWLHVLHIAMSAITVRNGKIVCPSCGTAYPIVDYIPNMMIE